MRKYSCGLLLAAVLGVAVPVHADEPLFGFVYTTDTLPQGKFETEQWLSWRGAKAHGNFDQIEGRTEFEYGATDALQLSLYANYAWMHAFRDSVDGTTVPSETFADYFPRVDPGASYSKARYTGTSLEAIYRVLSPYTNPVGLALYVEPTLGPGLYELESRLILQKNFLDDRLVFAANFTVAQEGRHLPADPEAEPGSLDARRHWDHETDVNFGIAGSWRFAPGWYLGGEFLNEREFSSFSLRSSYRTNSAYYLGPSLHYASQRWFVTATWLEQLRGARDYANPPPGFVLDGRTYADDFERHRIRVKLGINF